jgi:two-component system phosphate regulon sensor histidine kinase PhoR
MTNLIQLKGILISLLFGILLLQGLWIYDAYTERQLHINNHMQSAVNHAVEHYCRDIRSMKDADKLLKSNITEELKHFNEHINFEVQLIDMPLTNISKDLKQNMYFNLHCHELNINKTIIIQMKSKERYIFNSIISWIGLSALFILLLFIFTTLYFRNLSNQRQLQKMKDEFISNMTHELKTPISTISVASEILQNEKVNHDMKKIMRYAEIIHEENNRLKLLVDRVMQVALFESGRMTFMLEPTNIHELIQQTTQPLALLIQKRNGSLSLNLNASKSRVKADISHFKNIITNLVENAIKYNENEPIITITTSNEKHKISISIKDNGIGMDAKNSKYIFEKYYRIDPLNNQKTTGFGLGLFYVSKVIKGHGANIEVKSELGKGSEFIISMDQA